jgi:A/G-specific adenine glycosylase
MQSIEFPLEDLKDWFLFFRRDLPWRDNPTPYKVWISEVMLQQTQVAVVIPYFMRWMAAFPTIHALAEATTEKVLKVWEGLGYYSRARHLHEAAQFLLLHFKGEFPECSEYLSGIKGLGPYTIGAIRSFAYHEKAAAVDGNVKRVLSRFYGIEEAIDTASGSKKIWVLAENLLPDEEPWVINEALIELGAVICKKKPECIACPLKKSCIAYRQGRQAELPKKSKILKTVAIQRLVGVIHYQDGYYVMRREEGRIMGGLYEFPYIELKESIKKTEVMEKLSTLFGFALRYISPLSSQKHTFTQFRAELFPHLLQTENPPVELQKKGLLWQSRTTIKYLPFSSGHKRILKEVLDL